jgi:acetylornithine deacetylase/succinyl-diaminopimelate desuccinylase-like protein
MKKAALLLFAALPAHAQSLPPERALAREIYRQLVEINTTNSAGDNTAAAEAMASRLRAAGFPDTDVRVMVPEGAPKKGNLVARLRGTGARRPLLLLAHLDVVEAKREDWSFDPFVFREQDGYFYGRGTTDDKAMAAIFVANLIRYKQEGFRPERDLIVALTADEETDRTWNGVDFLLNKHRALIDAELGINEGGGGQIKDGKQVANTVQASEKIYQSFRLEVKNSGGHSSLPVPENAIYRLSEGLGKIARHKFPVHLNEVTRAFFTRSAASATGQDAADMKALLQNPPDPAAVERLSQRPYYNALLRTTCVATELVGGHAENALPQLARATVNCRILPDESPDAVRQTLVKVLGDDKIAIAPMQPALPSPPSPLTTEVMGAVERITQAMWPGVPVVPVMSTGATDAVYLRGAGIPIYGVDGLFEDIDDIRAHGRDERLGVTSFYEGQEFLYRLVKALAGR